MPQGFRIGLLDEHDFSEAVRVMCVSNREASIAAVEAGVHSATDVTGFGLLGNISQMVRPPLGATLHLRSVPRLAALSKLPKPPGPRCPAKSNLDYVRARVSLVGFEDSLDHEVLVDPQTSGGLLVAATSSSAARLLESGYVQVGEVNDSGRVEIVA